MELSRLQSIRKNGAFRQRKHVQILVYVKAMMGEVPSNEDSLIITNEEVRYWPGAQSPNR